jgi:hypothetical protein
MIFPIHQAVNIAEAQIPSSGNYPAGLFQSSTTINHEFFNDNNCQEYTNQLANDGMPFLYNLLHHVLSKSVSNNPAEEPVSESQAVIAQSDVADEDAKGLAMEEITYMDIPNAQTNTANRVDQVSPHKSECCQLYIKI